LPDTLATRKVLGVLVPYFNAVVEPELADLRPPGVTNQTGRFTMDAHVLADARETGTKLMTCGAEALLIGLSIESVPGGMAVLARAAAGLADDTGVPVFTASHATRAALIALGAKSISVVTPFDDTANTHVRAAFEEIGLRVVGLHGLACPSLDRIGHVSEADLLEAFRKADHPEAEAIVQVGTGLPTARWIPALERRHGKAVVAANAALYWQALRETGLDDTLPGAGRLGRLP
jgi:maleate isomerase